MIVFSTCFGWVFWCFPFCRRWVKMAIHSHQTQIFDKHKNGANLYAPVQNFVVATPRAQQKASTFRNCCPRQNILTLQLLAAHVHVPWPSKVRGAQAPEEPTRVMKNKRGLPNSHHQCVWSRLRFGTTKNRPTKLFRSTFPGVHGGGREGLAEASSLQA